MSENKIPSGIDRVVGQRLRWRRRELRLTQEQLGEQLGLTFQQVQKYEKGVNRISAGRLFEMSRVLNVSISYFYEGIDELLETLPAMAAEEQVAPAMLPSFDQETTELIIEFQKIKDASLRRSLLETIRAAAASFDDT